MQKKKNDIRLYSLVMPIWLLLAFPPAWLAVFAGNFLIDLAVILIMCLILKPISIKIAYKYSILKTWLFGILADFIGVGVLFLNFPIDSLLGSRAGDGWNAVTYALSTAPLSNVWSGLWTIAAILISGVAVFFVNYRIAFRLSGMSKKERFVISLVLGVVTAPWTMLIPIAAYM